MYIYNNSLTRHSGQELSVIEQSRHWEFSDGGTFLELSFHCKGAK